MHIRLLRLQKGWSQEQLADMAGVSVRTIQRIERGATASPETLKCLGAVFETDLLTPKETTPMPTPNPIASPNKKPWNMFVTSKGSTTIFSCSWW